MLRLGITLLVACTCASAARAQNLACADADATNGADWRALWRTDRNTRLEADHKLAFVPTSILVKFTDTSERDPAGRDALKARAGLRVEPIETWKLTPHLEHLLVLGDFHAALRTLRDSPLVDFAEPDSAGSLDAVPNDTNFVNQWGMRNTGQIVNADRGTPNADANAHGAWNLVTGSDTFVVAMVDSGFRRAHQDLAPNTWSNPMELPGDGLDNDSDGRIDDTWGWDFWNNDNDPSDDNGHGTHTTGIVGARGNNATGVTGVCWRVRLAALKVSGAQGRVTVSNAIGALDYCASKRFRLSNHSWRIGDLNQALRYSVDCAAFGGHLLVCAAGNGGSDSTADNNDVWPQYPCSFPFENIISVMALDNDDAQPRFTNYGALSVDIAAPGVTILSTGHASNSHYRYLSGTSQATPHVTGACALVWIRHPAWNFRQVRARVLETARAVGHLSARCATGGTLDIGAAVQ
jgi:subtilisin family serine protease